MIPLPLDPKVLAEDTDLECKKAAGRDGRGSLPRSFWHTYSAMANTDGGVVLLGVEERPRGSFRARGIQDVGRVKRQLWDGLNDRDQVSANLLRNEDVSLLEEAEKTILAVSVPRARRQERPVYVGSNPLRGTYRRNYEGDYLCSEDEVHRMLAERVEDSRDQRILQGFDVGADLVKETLSRYRNQFSATKPGHPWLDHDETEFLRCLGAYARDRETGDEGITLAGLLMFGRLEAIADALPNYFLDYQERPEPRTEPRWVDRVTTDGTWSGNLFDFYRLVTQKLFAGLKVPFQLEGERRVDDTRVHEAIREALTNTLIHADYSGRSSILVVRRPDLFGFRNPGTMRVPLREAIHGGTSDCRNRRLQKMFQLVGLGEQAGSGIPKIYDNWQRQLWRLPELAERKDPEETVLTLRMVSLLPEETLTELEERFGPSFHALSEVQRLALATVAIEGQVSHARLSAMSAEHPRDISAALAALVREDYLESSGATRGTYYYFLGEPPDGPEPVSKKSDTLESRSDTLESRSDTWDRLMEIGRPIRQAGKASTEDVQRVIMAVSQGNLLTLKQIGEILGRAEITVRQRYLAPMLKDRRMEMRYPHTPNHPGQAYTASSRRSIAE